ncbi:hypothetical protein [Janthinobacterium sp. CG_S6]|uniref:hypothetical protein n=1 Tax=Janthinobacterium sp. CG_S6 TaxID=3071707 RepID=UPI002DF7C4CA|nr:hypothetical protein [Janthinobacterium sp. CG_S6]
MSTVKTSRVLAVQVPGEALTPALDAAGAQLSIDQPPHVEAAKPESARAKVPELALPDLAEIRAEALEQARFEVRIELGEQLQAATAVLGQQAAPRSKSDYRRMRAADIDHTTLTSPVMTLDGYLCPPPPAAKA